jgi:malonyl-CoA O-methyltransferase
MDPHRRHLQARFSAAALVYDDFASVQRAVADRLLAGIAYVGAPRRVLDIGCGTGHLTRQLAATWPSAEVEGIDLAPGMIEQARRRSATRSRPVFIVGDAMRHTSAAPYDLLASSSTLHWIQPLRRTLAHLAGLLAPGGQFAFAIMLDQTLRELRAARAHVVPDNLSVESMPAAESVRSALAGVNLRLEQEEEESHVVHAPSAREMVRQLQSQGVTGGALSRGNRSLTRHQMHQLFAYYDVHFRDAAGVTATYHAGYYWGRRDA